MGIWKKQQSAHPPATPRPARPASHQRADQVRNKAQHYTDITERSGDQHHDRRKASRQREQAEKEMAALRAQALQARRLATRIENLHQPVKAQRKGRIMDTTITDPGQAQRTLRRTGDTPSPGSVQLSFNPLHPSMELPPEQLIRLLGLENKTIRRRKKRTPVATHARENNSAHSAHSDKKIKLLLPETPPASAERERDMVTPPFAEPGRGLVVPSLIVGAVAGIAISAYLILSGEANVAPPVTPATPAAKPAKHASPAANLRKAKPVTLPAATPAKPPAATPAKPPAPPLAETPRQGMVKRTPVIPQAKTVVEVKPLPSEAEPRMTAPVTEQKAADVTRAMPAVAPEPMPDMTTAPSSDTVDVEPATPDDGTRSPATAAEDVAPVAKPDIPQPVDEPVTTPASADRALTGETSLPEPATDTPRADPVEDARQPEQTGAAPVAGDAAKEGTTEEAVDSLF